jgi:hypothetical protein
MKTESDSSLRNHWTFLPEINTHKWTAKNSSPKDIQIKNGTLPHVDGF